MCCWHQIQSQKQLSRLQLLICLTQRPSVFGSEVVWRRSTRTQFPQQLLMQNALIKSQSACQVQHQISHWRRASPLRSRLSRGTTQSQHISRHPVRIYLLLFSDHILPQLQRNPLRPMKLSGKEVSKCMFSSRNTTKVLLHNTDYPHCTTFPTFS